LGKIGAYLSHFLIYKSFGLGAFIIAYQLCLTGVKILLKKKLSTIIIAWNWSLFIILWLSVSLGFMYQNYAPLSGIIGYEINDYLQSFIGKTGLIILLSFLLNSVYNFKIQSDL